MVEIPSVLKSYVLISVVVQVISFASVGILTLFKSLKSVESFNQFFKF